MCFVIAEWKNNFLRLKQMVLIGGPDDGVITPWQSRWVKLKLLSTSYLKENEIE